MAEEVIPGVPRSAEPLTRRLRSVHARLDLSIHHFIPSEFVAVHFVHKPQADYDHRNMISPFVFAREKCSS